MNPEKLYKGKPCKNCGGTTRYKSCSACVACSIERARARHTDPEVRAKERERLREYYHVVIKADPVYRDQERLRKLEYRKTPDARERRSLQRRLRSKYDADYRAKQREYDRAYRARKKQEKLLQLENADGNSDPFRA